MISDPMTARWKVRVIAILHKSNLFNTVHGYIVEVSQITSFDDNSKFICNKLNNTLNNIFNNIYLLIRVEFLTL